MIKYKYIILSIVIILNMFFNFANAAESLDRIIVTVNESVITQSELNKALETTKQQMLAANVPIPSAADLRKQVLDQLIDKKLQLDLARQANIQISDQQVNKAIATIAKNNHFSVDELYQKVEAQGISRTEYRKEIRDEMTIQQLQQQEVAPRVSITPQEVNDFIRTKAWASGDTNVKEYHLEDILIPLPENPTVENITAAKNTANSILAKIHNGANFSTITTIENAEIENNDLGWRKLPEIPNIFANNVTQMKVNETAAPIQAPNGLHILHLAGIRDAGGANSVAPTKKQIEQLVFQRKFQEAVKAWVAKLRTDAIIKMNP